MHKFSNFIMQLKNIYASFSYFKFNVKKKFLSLPFRQVNLLKKNFNTQDFWNQQSFPNYDLKGSSNIAKFTNRNSTTQIIDRANNATLINSLLRSFSSTYSTRLYPIYTYSLSLFFWLLNTFKRSIGDGAIYIRGLIILFAFDAMLTDDEPLWEPVEWSLLQSWILFIFAFAWIAENLITSRYGSYTGRDKRVWFAWYKTFWLIEGYYALTLAVTALFVIVPFYHEISYTLPLVVSWWNWYSRIFFFKFVSVYSLVLYLAYYLQLNLGSFYWRKSLLIILIINVFISYLIYTHCFMSFFAYFTDPNWYHKTRIVDYVQLSHEPNKWSWGTSKRDHFSYHNSRTVMWYKNDGPFASAFLLFNIFFFLCLFGLYIYWLALFRRVYATKEITFTYTTYCVSGLRQFFYYFLFLYLFVIFSFVVQYWRLPIEYAWILNTLPLAETFIANLTAYPSFIFSILF